METETIKENQAIIWRPKEELEDPVNLKEAVAVVKSNGMKTVLLDLSAKEWVSSSEIGVVMWVFKELESLGTNLNILATSPFVMKTIKLTGIDQLLPVFDSLEKALETINS